jgi:transcriptional antiterminator NusG
VSDSGVSVDRSAPADPSDETQKPEFPGFREGQDDGAMPEAGGSVQAPEEDAELEAARVDEEVEADEPATDTDLADAVENDTDQVDAEDQGDTDVVTENADRTDTALEDERPDAVVEETTADTSETVPEFPSEDPVATDVLQADDAPEVPEDQSLSEAAPLDAEESDGEFGTGAPVEDPSTATASTATEAAAPATESAVAATDSTATKPAKPAKDAAQPKEEATAEDEDAGRANPFRGPGEWYVVHTYAGYENKVKTNLESRIHTMQMEEKIFDVHIPMEDVMEIKSGKKQVVQRKVFPGYLLVKMVYDNDSWYVVRNTPGVTGFVSAGTGTKPTPLSKREVEKILAVKKEEVKPQFRLEFEESDVVRIISGPFADFNGTISEINLDQSKLKVLVNIFDRETPVELGFDQVQKV